MQERHGNLRTVSGILNNSVLTDFIVDTGSSFTVVGHTTFEILQERTNPKPVRAARAGIANGQEVILYIYEVKSITIGSCKYNNVEIALNTTDTYDMIGWSLMKRMGDITFNHADKTMEVSECPK